jgi:hypothetical protein
MFVGKEIASIYVRSLEIEQVYSYGAVKAVVADHSGTQHLIRGVSRDDMASIPRKSVDAPASMPVALTMKGTLLCCLPKPMRIWRSDFRPRCNPFSRR